MFPLIFAHQSCRSCWLSWYIIKLGLCQCTHHWHWAVGNYY